MPFCVQLNATSMPFLSTSTGIVPSDVTVSAITSASTSRAASANALPGLYTPVEVSAWTNAITCGRSR